MSHYLCFCSYEFCVVCVILIFFGLISYGFVANSRSEWSTDNTRIVYDIFAEEVNGNRSSTHLNEASFSNVRTNILYTRNQFKNKWDKFKIDY